MRQDCMKGAAAMDLQAEINQRERARATRILKLSMMPKPMKVTEEAFLNFCDRDHALATATSSELQTWVETAIKTIEDKAQLNALVLPPPRLLEY